MDVIGRLADGIEEAAAESRAATASAEAALAGVAQERHWRHVAVWVSLVAVGLGVVGAAVFVTTVLVLFNRQGAILDRVTVNPAGCAASAAQHSETLACDNYQSLQTLKNATSPQAAATSRQTLANAIASIVAQTDCNERRNSADVLHIALPAVRFVLPATSACPAYNPG